VKLVDISKTGVERITQKGVVGNGEEFAVDAIVCATGFAAMTGSFDKMDIQGRDGLTLKTAWEAGPRTYLGLSTVGFPNFFMITGPGSPSVLAQMIQSIEQHADWIVDCMAHMRDVGAESLEPTLEVQDAWVDHVNEVSKISLRSTCSSWYVGANIPGRPRVFMPYIGGFPIYVQKCNEVQTNGYEGFVIEGGEARNAEPTVRETERWRVPLDVDVISPAMLASGQVPLV
jgi:cyclohexanone monooxygenase